MAEIKDCLSETTEGFPAVSRASAWQCTCIWRAFRLGLAQKRDSNLLPLYLKVTCRMIGLTTGALLTRTGWARHCRIVSRAAIVSDSGPPT
jgi:hypothetical protein